jgi:hypothetical protein
MEIRMHKKLIRLLMIAAVLLMTTQAFAGSIIGKAIIPKDLATPDQIFDACQDSIVESGYTVDSIDKASGLISASNERNTLGSKKVYKHTWTVTIRPKESEGVTELTMARGFSGVVKPRGTEVYFIDVLEKMKLDLSKIDITIAGETKKASEWK